VLDRLAAEGTLFQDCVGQASWTKVATPSLMTSLYPTSHGVLDFFDRLPASAVTLAEAYRDAGYATLSLSSILFTGKFTNLHQGFEEVHEDGSLPDRRSSKTAREYVDRLLPWLEAHRQLPFFVFLHVSDPHDPYKPYPPYDTLWADASKSEPHEREAKEVKEFIGDPLMKLFGMPTRAELVEAGIDPQA
jgi:diadenosine tetraphosphatase ApaH/serine/threonine PP2A family protein phosphatase